jgi:hypothetical protein
MGWKAIGMPTVRRQRGRWVVRVDGIDTETGKHRPRQLGTYASQRSAQAAARSIAAQERVGARDSVSWLVRRWVASRTDVSQKAREQYEWATRHIEAGLGASGPRPDGRGDRHLDHLGQRTASPDGGAGRRRVPPARRRPTGTASHDSDGEIDRPRWSELLEPATAVLEQRGPSTRDHVGHDLEHTGPDLAIDL